MCGPSRASTHLSASPSVTQTCFDVSREMPEGPAQNNNNKKLCTWANQSGLFTAARRQGHTTQHSIFRRQNIHLLITYLYIHRRKGGRHPQSHHPIFSPSPKRRSLQGPSPHAHANANIGPHRRSHEDAKWIRQPQLDWFAGSGGAKTRPAQQWFPNTVGIYSGDERVILLHWSSHASSWCAYVSFTPASHTVNKWGKLDIISGDVFSGHFSHMWLGRHCNRFTPWRKILLFDCLFVFFFGIINKYIHKSVCVFIEDDRKSQNESMTQNGSPVWTHVIGGTAARHS